MFAPAPCCKGLQFSVRLREGGRDAGLTLEAEHQIGGIQLKRHVCSGKGTDRWLRLEGLEGRGAEGLGEAEDSKT